MGIRRGKERKKGEKIGGYQTGKVGGKWRKQEGIRRRKERKKGGKKLENRREKELNDFDKDTKIKLSKPT